MAVLENVSQARHAPSPAVMARGGYRHLSFRAKRGYSIPKRILYRCAKCSTAVEEQDCAGHLERCWPDAVMDKFTKVK